MCRFRFKDMEESCFLINVALRRPSCIACIGQPAENNSAFHFEVLSTLSNFQDIPTSSSPVTMAQKNPEFPEKIAKNS